MFPLDVRSVPRRPPSADLPVVTVAWPDRPDASGRSLGDRHAAPFTVRCPSCSGHYGFVRTSVSAGRFTESSRLRAFMYALADATMMSVSAPRPT